MDNNSLIADYSQWERGKDYPDYMDDVALSTISKGYLMPGETPRKAYRRVANAVADRLKVSLALFSAIPVLIGACLLVVLVLILRIRYVVLALLTQSLCDLLPMGEAWEYPLVELEEEEKA
jgi:hypothetical protein